MTRYLRIATVALALVLLVVGSAFANGSPTGNEHRSPVAASHQPDASPGASDGQKDEQTDANNADVSGAPPTQAELDRLVGLLDRAGITTDDAQLSDLIARYGVGGAVRVLAWGDVAGGADQVTALRDQGLGWGQIAKQLNEGDDSLSLRPGIGWIMSGGHGQGTDAKATGSQGKATGKATAPGQAGKH